MNYERKNNIYKGRNSNFQKKPDSRKNYIIGGNLKEQYQKTRSAKETQKRRWTSTERQ